MKTASELDSAEPFGDEKWKTEARERQRSPNSTTEVRGHVQFVKPLRGKKLDGGWRKVSRRPFARGGGGGSYLGRRRSRRSCSRDAALDRYVATRCCHGNCDRGGQEGGDDREGKEPRAVVAIGNGRGAAVIGSTVVEAGRTNVSALPGCPVVPLEAVVVA